jgi:hypothetical protein
MLFKTPKFWQTNNFISCILTPLSWIYIIAHRANLAFQTPKKFNKKKSLKLLFEGVARGCTAPVLLLVFTMSKGPFMFNLNVMSALVLLV